MTAFCRFCGRPLPESEVPMVLCPFCGQPLNPTGSFKNPSPAAPSVPSVPKAGPLAPPSPMTDRDGGTSSMSMDALLRGAGGGITDHDGGTSSMSMDALLRGAGGGITDHDGGTSSMSMDALLSAASNGPAPASREGGTSSMSMDALLRAAAQSAPPPPAETDHFGDFFGPKPTVPPPSGQKSTPPPAPIPSVPASAPTSTLKCANCQRALLPNAKFCDNCGTPVVAAPQSPVCPNCGTESTPNAKFCMNCGTPLNKPAPTRVPLPPEASFGPSAPASAPVIPAPVAAPAPAVPAPAASAGIARFEVQPSRKIVILPKKDGPLMVGRSDSERGIVADVDFGPFEAKRLGVSRSHGHLYRHGDKWLFEDLNSPNFTHVNGTRAMPGEMVTLKHGDEIRFGELVVRLLLD